MNEGALKNQYQYQGDYSEFDDETQWNEFALRNYDPQIGRFVQADPYDQFPSPYTGMGNDPVNMVDPSGGFSLSAITGSTNILFNTAVTTIGGALIGGIVGMATGDDKGWLKGAAVGAAVGLAGSVNWGSLASSNLSKIGITTRIFSAAAHGVKIELLYKKPAITPLTDFNWIQTIRTNDPLGGATSPYNDPQPSDDIGTPKPFYWTDPELPTENVSPGYDARFYDAPSRGASPTKVVKWKAELSIVGKNAKGEYQTIGTVKYGFKIKKDGTVVVRKLRTRWISGFQKRTIKTAR